MADRFTTSLADTLGLNELESRVYQSLLRTGPKRAAEIAKACGVTRTNTYHVLTQLERRGLLERQGTGHRKMFAALHPRRLIGLLEQEEQRVRSVRNQLEDTLQSLVIDFSLAEGKPGVFRFEGKEGMIRVYGELIRDRVTVNSIVDRGKLRQIIADYNPEYVRKRIRNKIRSRVITPAAKPLPTEDGRELREVRYLDPRHFPFEMDLKITEKKVVMTTFAEDAIVGIIMIDAEIVRNYLILFEFLWRIARTADAADL